MQLSQLVAISISRNTQAVSQAGFGVAMILGSNKVAAGVGSYGSLLEVLDEPGLTSSTDEYKAAAKLFGQTPHPVTVKIGKALSKVAQVDTITPTAANSTAYHVTLTQGATAYNYTYTSDGSATVSEIVAGLIALINVDTASHLVVATGTTTLILTSNTLGQPFSTSTNASANMTLVHTTANVGVVESLAALSLTYDDDWYALISTFRSAIDVMQIAAYIEGLPKLFGVSSSASGLYDPASTTDIAYLLSAGSYYRTFVLYSADSANFPEASFFGRVLPTAPGSETWAFKTLAGTTVDNLNGAAITALKTKHANYFVPCAGKNITLDGKVAGGEYIDIIRLIDKLTSDMMVEIFASLTTNDKIPFTNGGIALIESDISGVLRASQKIGGVAPDDVDADGNLVPGFSTTFPNVFNVSSNDRANRVLSGGTFRARLAGAIQAISVSGNVTV